MPKIDRPAKRPGSRPWLFTAIGSGLLLVGLIVVGLWSGLGRLGNTMELMDQPGARSEDFSRLAEESARTTRLSLYAGAPVAVLYITALVMYRRSKRRPKDS